MPVEIKELNIRVTVAGTPPETGKAARNADAKGDDAGGHGASKDEIVAECIEQVLQILQAKKER